VGVREAAYAAHLIRPKVFIPMHYGTFPDQKADLQELKDLLKTFAPFTNLIVTRPGEPFNYAP